MEKPVHPLTPEEARQALELIEVTGRHIRRLAAYGGVPYILIIWGLVWMVGFGAGYLGMPQPAHGWLWLTLDLLGLGGTFWVVHRVVRSQGEKVHWALGSTIGKFWLSWLTYGALFIYFAQPDSGNQTTLLISLWIMAGYLVIGLFLRSRLFTWLGIILTILIVLGYVLLSEYFDLWMALVGGGGLIATGVAILWTWR